jgi:uncharacterized membrane protein (UPF0127 family)
MAKLIRDGEVLSEVEIAATLKARLRGLIGSKHFEGLLLLRPANSVHTFFMRFPIDVAFLDRNLKIIDITAMKPWRIGWPRSKARSVMEARQGLYDEWNLRVGDVVEIVS